MYLQFIVYNMYLLNIQRKQQYYTISLTINYSVVELYCYSKQAYDTSYNYSLN